MKLLSSSLKTIGVRQKNKNKCVDVYEILPQGTIPQKRLWTLEIVT